MGGIPFKGFILKSLPCHHPGDVQVIKESTPSSFTVKFSGGCLMSISKLLNLGIRDIAFPEGQIHAGVQLYHHISSECKVKVLCANHQHTCCSIVSSPSGPYCPFPDISFLLCAWLKSDLMAFVHLHQRKVASNIDKGMFAL